MPYDYEREVRTTQSEAYIILDGENPVGRIDIHFMPGVAHVAIAVDRSVTQERIDEIVADIDSDLLNTVGNEQDTHHFHIFQGTEIRVFSNAGYDDYGGGNGNGRGQEPLPPPQAS